MVITTPTVESLPLPPNYLFVGDYDISLSPGETLRPYKSSARLHSASSLNVGGFPPTSLYNVAACNQQDYPSRIRQTTWAPLLSKPYSPKRSTTVCTSRASFALTALSAMASISSRSPFRLRSKSLTPRFLQRRRLLSSGSSQLLSARRQVSKRSPGAVGGRQLFVEPPDDTMDCRQQPPRPDTSLGRLSNQQDVLDVCSFCCRAGGHFCTATTSCSSCQTHLHTRFLYLARCGYIPTIPEVAESDLSSGGSTNNERSPTGSSARQADELANEEGTDTQCLEEVRSDEETIQEASSPHAFVEQVPVVDDRDPGGNKTLDLSPPLEVKTDQAFCTLPTESMNFFPTRSAVQAERENQLTAVHSATNVRTTAGVLVAESESLVDVTHADLLMFKVGAPNNAATQKTTVPVGRGSSPSFGSAFLSSLWKSASDRTLRRPRCHTVSSSLEVRAKLQPSVRRRDSRASTYSASSRSRQILEDVKKARSASIRAAHMQGRRRSAMARNVQEWREWESEFGEEVRRGRTWPRSGSSSTRSWGGGTSGTEEWDRLYWDTLRVYSNKLYRNQVDTKTRSNLQKGQANNDSGPEVSYMEGSKFQRNEGTVPLHVVRNQTSKSPVANELLCQEVSSPVKVPAFPAQLEAVKHPTPDGSRPQSYTLTCNSWGGGSPMLSCEGAINPFAKESDVVGSISASETFMSVRYCSAACEQPTTEVHWEASDPSGDSTHSRRAIPFIVSDDCLATDNASPHAVSAFSMHSSPPGDRTTGSSLTADCKDGPGGDEERTVVVCLDIGRKAKMVDTIFAHVKSLQMSVGSDSTTSFHKDEFCDEDLISQENTAATVSRGGGQRQHIQMPEKEEEFIVGKKIADWVSKTLATRRRVLTARATLAERRATLRQLLRRGAAQAIAPLTCGTASTGNWGTADLGDKEQQLEQEEKSPANKDVIITPPPLNSQSRDARTRLEACVVSNSLVQTTILSSPSIDESSHQSCVQGTTTTTLLLPISKVSRYHSPGSTSSDSLSPLLFALSPCSLHNSPVHQSCSPERARSEGEQPKTEGEQQPEWQTSSPARCSEEQYYAVRPAYLSREWSDPSDFVPRSGSKTTRSPGFGGGVGSSRREQQLSTRYDTQKENEMRQWSSQPRSGFRRTRRSQTSSCLEAIEKRVRFSDKVELYWPDKIVEACMWNEWEVSQPPIVEDDGGGNLIPSSSSSSSSSGLLNCRAL